MSSICWMSLGRNYGILGKCYVLKSRAQQYQDSEAGSTYLSDKLEKSPIHLTRVVN